MHRSLRALFLAPLLVAGCDGGGAAGGNSNDEPRLPATDYLLVECADGVVLVGELPTITIVETDDGSPPLIEARGEAVDDDGTRLWYFYARIDQDDLVDGFAQNYMVLGATATTPGIVNVGIESPPGGDLEVARAGTASLQRDDGWFLGQIDNADPRMAADFSGGYAVSCSYRDPADPSRLRVDDTFESEFCAPFAGVRPPEPGTAP